MMSLLAQARQLRYPREYRIEEPSLAPDLVDVLRELASRAPPPAPAEQDDEHRLFADLGTGIWRLRQRMLIPGTDQPKEQLRREYRHVEAVWDLLARSGVKIQSHDGQPYREGLALEVVARESVEGIAAERVRETIRPTIHHKGTLIQQGQVIIDIPASDAA